MGAHVLLYPKVAAGLCAADVDGAALVLADLDGCLISERRAFPDTAAFVAGCGARLWIVSNNATHTAAELSGALAQIGVPVPAGRILLAGEQTLLHLAHLLPGAGLAMYASDSLRDRAASLGLRTDTAEPDHVLLCRDMSFAIPQIEEVTRHLARGAALWVSNTDLSHPGLDGQPVPETGALLAALRAVAPDLTFRCLGKPHTHMVAQVLKVAGARAADAVFIGDNAETDGKFAAAAGIPFIHLRRGPAA
ncbi:MAG: HAD family hydrolase [Pseudomonadota bacterium]